MTRAELAKRVNDIKRRARSGRCATAAASYDMLIRYHGRELERGARRRLGNVVDKCFRFAYRKSEPDNMHGARRRRR